MDWSRYLEQQGRQGDTILAHITPEEAALLERLGGSGTINPRTGFREFYSGDDDDAGDTSASGGPGDTSGGGMDAGMGDPGDTSGGGLDPGIGGLGGFGANFADPTGMEHTGLHHSEFAEVPGVTSEWGLPEVWKALKQSWNFALEYLPILAKLPAVIANPPIAIPILTMQLIQRGMGGPRSIVSGAKAVAQAGYQAFFGTEEQKAVAVEAMNAEWGRQVQENLAAGESGPAANAGFDVAESWGADLAKENKLLDVVFDITGKRNDLNTALQAVKNYESGSLNRTLIEKEILNYSNDPEYQAIEPEVRLGIDAAIRRGMTPKQAVAVAFKDSKTQLAMKKYIKELMGGINSNMQELGGGGLAEQNLKMAGMAPVGWEERMQKNRNESNRRDTASERIHDEWTGINTQIRDFVPENPYDRMIYDANEMDKYRQRYRKQGVSL